VPEERSTTAHLSKKNHSTLESGKHETRRQVEVLLSHMNCSSLHSLCLRLTPHCSLLLPITPPSQCPPFQKSRE
jgi:hypothetical protein